MGDCSGTGGVRGGPMRVIFYNKKRYPKHKGGARGLQWWWYTTKYKLPRFFSTVCIGLRKSLGRKERNMTGIMALEDALMQLVREVGKERSKQQTKYISSRVLMYVPKQEFTYYNGSSSQVRLQPHSVLNLKIKQKSCTFSKY